MRALKTILIIVIALIGLVVILGLMGSKSFRVERSTTIKAPAHMVYENVASLEKMNDWGPWKEEEHNMTVTYDGAADASVGAVSKWTSDESQGMQEITALEEDKSVRTKLTFIKPWEAVHTGTFDLAAMGDSTKVTWGIQGENNFMGRVMSVFMDMDKMVGPMFEKGLVSLKTMTEEECRMMEEEHAKLLSSYTIETGARPAMAYAGTRQIVKWQEMGKFFSENLPGAAAGLAKSGVKPIGAPAGVYFKWDEENQQADLLAGMPIALKDTAKVKGLTVYTTPASQAYWTKYMGGYHNMGPAHEALEARIKKDGKEFNTNVIEEYVTDPMTVPDSTKWQTNIIWLAK